MDGPATRPQTPLAVENGVGKPAAPRKRERLMSAREREIGALPSPICPCSTERLGRDFLFWGLGRNIQRSTPDLEPSRVEILTGPQGFLSPPSDAPLDATGGAFNRKHGTDSAILTHAGCFRRVDAGQRRGLGAAWPKTVRTVRFQAAPHSGDFGRYDVS